LWRLALDLNLSGQEFIVLALWPVFDAEEVHERRASRVASVD
jgi:hypothetical protein